MLDYNALLLMMGVPCHQLNSNTDFSHDFTSYRLLPVTEVREDILYVGEELDVLELWSRHGNERCTVFFSGDTHRVRQFSKECHMNLVGFDMPFSALCNRVIETFAMYNNAHRTLELCKSPDDIQSVINELTNITGCYCFLVDQYAQVVARSSKQLFEDSVVHSLKDVDYIEPKTIKSWSAGPVWDKAVNCIEMFIKESGHFAYNYVFKYKGNATANLMVISPYSTRNEAILGIMEDFTPGLSTLCRDMYFSSLQKNADFSAYLFDVLEGNIETKEDYYRRIQNLGIDIPCPYRMIVIAAFEDKLMPVKYEVIYELRSLFGCQSCGVYMDNYVVLAPVGSDEKLLNFSTEAFTALLRKFDMYACVGSSTGDLEYISKIYTRMAVNINIARHIDHDLNGRFFTLNDYFLYYMIHLAVTNPAFDREKPWRQLTPEYKSIALYDQKNGTDYAEILTSYLLSDGNISQMAQELYMHRNTLTRKMVNIKNILGRDLDDPDFRMQLLLCSHIAKYLNLMNTDAEE